MTTEKTYPLKKKRRRSVVGTGLVALDIIINGDLQKKVRYLAGGTCGNVLAILSFLGWDSYPVGRLASSRASKLISKDLMKWGVHLDFLNISPTGDSPVITHKIHPKMRSSSDHTFSSKCPLCNAFLPRYKAIKNTQATIVKEKINSPTIYFLDRLSRGAIELAKVFLSTGALVVFEPSSRANDHLFLEALEIAHVLKYSNERFGKMRRRYRRVIPLLEIETFGARGLRFKSSLGKCKVRDWRSVPAMKISNVKDSAGAGDWTTAGIIDRLVGRGLEGVKKATTRDVLEALRFGQTLAAWNCAYEGARGGMYSLNRKQLLKNIKNLSGKNVDLKVNSEVSHCMPYFRVKGLCSTIHR